MSLDLIVSRLEGLDFSTKEGLEKSIVCLSGKGDTDELLYAGLMYLRKHPQTHRPAFRRIVEELSGFYIDSNVPELAEMMRLANEKFTQQQAKTDLMSRDLTGTQLMHTNGRQGVLFLPDASEPGRFRASYFDERGFYSHITRDTYAQVLEDVWLEGFRPTTTPMLEQWAVTSTWQAGSEITLAIQQVGLGKMTHDEYLALAQWHSNKDAIIAHVECLRASPLEQDQQVQELQKWSVTEFGMPFSEKIAKGLIVDPRAKPDLSSRLFSIESKPSPILMSIQSSPEQVNQNEQEKSVNAARKFR